MKAYLSIPNWEEFQHYKDRNPPWIKLHNQLLENYEFECLPDASKAHLLCIWLLASRTENNFVNDAKWIGRKIGANSTVNLKVLIESGFLQLNQEDPEPEHDASMALQLPEQSAGTEGEQSRAETEGETENKPNKNDTFEIFQHWCETMKKNPAVAKLTPKREKAIKARLKDGYTAAQIKTAIHNCSLDKFSMGQNDRQKVFNDIELICRNGEKLESFLEARVVKTGKLDLDNQTYTSGDIP